MRYFMLLSSVLVWVVVGCGGSGGGEATSTPSPACPECVSESNLHFEPHFDLLTAGVGETVPLKVVVECVHKGTEVQRIEDVTVCSHYSIEENSIATLNSHGVLEAKQVGSTTIEVVYAALQDILSLEVVPPYVQYLHITPQSKILEKDKFYYLHTEGIKSDKSKTSVSNVVWKAKDRSCVKVENYTTDTGVVTGLKPCVTTVTGTIVNALGKEVSDSAEVKVTLKVNG